MYFSTYAEDQAVSVVVGLQRWLGRPPSRKRAPTSLGRPGVPHRGPKERTMTMRNGDHDEKRCRIKLTRSILLTGRHAERGEVVDVEVQLANWLVEQGAAKRNLWLRVTDRVRAVWRQMRARKVV